MTSTAIATVTKMLESLPESVQDQVVEHLREYLADLQDELEWDGLFKRTQPRLEAAARRAKQEIAEGHAQPLNYDEL
jgi:predicted ATPase